MADTVLVFLYLKLAETQQNTFKNKIENFVFLFPFKFFRTENNNTVINTEYCKSRCLKYKKKAFVLYISGSHYYGEWD